MKMNILRCLMVWGGVVAFCLTQIAMAIAAEPPLTLESAIKQAKINAPSYQAAKAELQIVSGGLEQAKAWQNPSLDIEAENFGGSGSFRGTREAEYTYMISQPIEIGGKRSARRKSAESAHKAALVAYKVAEMQLVQAVETAYYQAIAASEALALAQQQEAFAKNVLNIVKQKVKAGRESDVQAQKAKVSYQTAILQRYQAERKYSLAMLTLKNTMGIKEGALTPAKPLFFKLEKPRPYGAYQAAIAQSPHYLKAQELVKASKYDVAFQKAQNIPDPTLRFGVREFSGPDEHAFVAGVSFPLPVFNQNGGNIRKAYGAQLLAEQQKRQTAQSLEQQLLNHWQQWQQGAMEAQQLEQNILPAAKKSAHLAQESYNNGRFPFIEFLDAQRTYFQTQEQYINALSQMHQSRAAVLAIVTPNFEESTHE